jgi:hypothetical protein
MRRHFAFSEATNNNGFPLRCNLILPRTNCILSYVMHIGYCILNLSFLTELEDAVSKARAEEIRIPFGVGIAGSVAQSKQPINIRDAYADPRFNADIDLRTGYRTRLVLCLPICNYEGDVIGVAEIINKTNGKRYFLLDSELFKLRLLIFNNVKSSFIFAYNALYVIFAI